MNSDSDLEVLLVLCCLVAVVVFLCFSIGAVNLSALTPSVEAPSPGAPSTETEPDVETQKIAEKEMELSRLQKQLDDLRTEIEAIRLELARMLLAQTRVAEANEAEAKKKEAEIRDLIGKMEELNRQLDEQRKILNALNVPADDAMERDLGKLQAALSEAERQIQDIRRRTADLSQETDVFRPWRDVAGSTQLRNPLFAECRKDSLVLLPEQRSIALSELKQKDPFTSLTGGNDGIVFLIRPDGFEVFQQAFPQARKTGLKLCYEVVDAHLRLEFAR